MVKVKWDVEKQEWYMVPEIEGGMYLNEYLRDNLDFVRKDLRDDSDAIMVISGKERSGKSVFAMQLAMYIDPTFMLDRVCFNPSEFRKAVLAAQKFQCVVFDEAITGTWAQRWASEVNLTLIELLAQIGQKNLCIIVVIPSFFELNKYVAIHRSVALLYVHRKDGRRGYFRLFNEDKKTMLYFLGKKTYDMNQVVPNFFGAFTNYYVVDEAAYRKKKLDSLTHYARNDGQETNREIRHMERFFALSNGLVKDEGWKIKDVIALANRRATRFPVKESEIKEVLQARRGVWARFNEILEGRGAV